jgi:general stress protein 26
MARYHHGVDAKELIAFIRRHRWAVQASTSLSGAAQAAVIGVAISESAELCFDTNIPTRKCQNLRRDPRIAVVIGWDDQQTVQYEGIADEPVGSELVAVKAAYFAHFPDGRTRESWPDITYFRVKPTWIRYSDFRGPSPKVIEFVRPDLTRRDRQ